MTIDLENFIKEYFSKVDKYVLTHKKVLETFKNIDINYLILKPVLIDQAVSFLHSVDSSFPDKELKKEIEELNEIYNFYKEMLKKSEMLEMFFYESYLHKNSEYKKIYEEIQAINNHIKYLESAMKRIDLSKDDKHSKTMYANLVTELDTIRAKKQQLHKKLTQIEEEKKEEFFKIFPKKLKAYIEAVEYVLNVMIMVLSKLIWLKAKESAMINDFFKKINKKISMDVFIADYLKKNPLHKKPEIRSEMEKIIRNKI
jgi:hypothetical protein